MPEDSLPLNLRRIRKARGMSQRKLADMAGISQPAIAKLEHGKSVPNVDTLRKIAHALQVDILKLIAPIKTLSGVRFRIGTMSKREQAIRDEILEEARVWLDNYRELEELLGQRISYFLCGFREEFQSVRK